MPRCPSVPIDAIVVARRCCWTLLLGLLGCSVVSPAIAQQGGSALDARASDPSLLEWMQGSPPPADRIIRGTDADFFNFPKLRWSVCHIRELMPTKAVRRGLGVPRQLERRLDPTIDRVTFQPLGSDDRMTWEESLFANYTDGVVVLHRGRIVYERYLGGLDEGGQHVAMSMTKSVVGLLAEILISEGALDPDSRVDRIVPELRDSAFGDATVRQVLDMTTGLRYSEDYADPDADVWVYTMAASPLPKPADYDGPRSYFEFLQTVRPQGAHGEAFGYKTINTDAMGWILARVAGKPLHQLLADRLWSPMGAEQDAYFTVDSIGTPYAGGGLSAGLRDMARLGQLVLDGGVVNGVRLFPSDVVERIRRGGDQQAFAGAGYATLPGGSYKGMWWILHNEHGAFAARGVHGQTIYIDPTAEMVIARFASHPSAFNSAIDPTSLPAYQAVAVHLMRSR